MTEAVTNEVGQAAPATAPAVPDATNTGGVTAAPVEQGNKPGEAQQPRTFTEDEVEARVEKRLKRDRQARERELDSIVSAKVAQALQGQQPKAPQTVQDDKGPQRDTYGDYEQYVEARAEWAAERKFTQKLADHEKSQREAKEAQERETVFTTFNERMQKAAAKFEDFEDVARNPSLPITDAMFDAIQRVEEGPEVAYYLGHRPAEAQRISQLSPTAQAAEIGRLAARIAAGASTDAPASTATAPAPKPAPVSKAPEPINPVGGKAVVEKDPSQMTDKEFDAWFDKRRGKKR